MTLTIELTPEEETQLLAAARLEGLDATEYARRRLMRTPVQHVQQSAQPKSEPLPKPVSRQKQLGNAAWVTLFESLFDVPKPPTPEISGDELRREQIYQDAGEEENNGLPG